MATIAEVLTYAWNRHQAGDFGQAEQLYRQILAVEPAHADALHLLGVLAFQVGRPDLAIDFHQKAIAVNPTAVAFHFDLAVAFRVLGRRDEGIASYRRVVQLQPNNAEAYNNLGNALRERGDLEEAVNHYRQALWVRPSFAEAYNNMANALRDQGKLEDAAASYRQAIQLKPDYAAAYNNLGVVLADQGKLAESVACHRYAVRLQPDYVEAHGNLAHVLQETGECVEAEAHAREAIRLRPDFAEAHNNLGNVLLAQGKREEAVAAYQQAIRCNPDYGDAHANLGVAYANLGKWEDAVACYEQALRVQPSSAIAHWSLALAQLLLGDYERGWPGYEWRRTQPGYRKPALPQPLWDGSELGGRTILLYAEQGMGDTLQFIRYAPLVKQRGGRVIVECQAALQSLLASAAGIDQLIVRGSPLPPFDVHAPLLSLPGILRTTVATIPATVPYLNADKALVEHWRKELDRHRSRYAPRDDDSLKGSVRATVKIGIVWQGNPGYSGDRQRFIALARWSPLTQLKGVEFFSLQVGTGVEQLADVAGRFKVHDLGSCFNPSSLADAAAAIMNLDLVVTVDTVTAHLAGALGAAVWIAVPLSADWRWMLQREDSPWYPTARLFRQPQPDDWTSVFARMADALELQLAKCLSLPPRTA